MMETDSLPYKYSTPRQGAHSRQKRQAPYMIFPEILVIVDYDGYRLHGEDNVAIKRYVISFWNGVDLRYKLLQGPSVKISIAGIIISRVCLSLLLLLVNITFLPSLSCPDLNPPSFS